MKKNHVWQFVSYICLFFSFIFMNVGLLLGVKEICLFIDCVLVQWGSCEVTYVIFLDWVAMIFMGFVLLISGSVLYFSGEYMEDEDDINRFIMLIVVFIISMNLLIISPNLISVMLGWDGLGLVSYCLVVYYQNKSSYNAGSLTVLSNRLGDVLMLMGIGLMCSEGDWTFFSFVNGKGSMMDLVSVMVLLGSMTKSAQVPFSAWLPAAMAAPTPVSALVHSSTLVTAGVYLMYRFMINISCSVMLEILMVLSIITMMMAGIMANFEWDLKKIIALSTLSQLGLMMYSLSMNMVDLALFHMLIHALFKALLFMAAGCLIHGMMGWQDIRRMGGLMHHMPYTSCCFVVAVMALSGYPFLSGFYSKDLILDMSMMNSLNIVSMLFLLISVSLTMMYSMRMIYYVIIRDYSYVSVLSLSDGCGIMMYSTSMLLLGSIVGGSMVSWLILDPYMISMFSVMKGMISVLLLIGMWSLSFLIPYIEGNLVFHNKVFYFFSTMWFLPYLSTQYMIVGSYKVGKDLMVLGDCGWMEIMGGTGIMKMLLEVSYKVIVVDFMQFYYYTLILWLSTALLFFW